MRVLRGRAETIAADRQVVAAALARAADGGEPVVRAWRPHRQVAFGRRDANVDGYEDARRIASERGFDPVERSVGGRAVAYTGATLAFARCEPADDPRAGIDERYEAASRDVEAALDSLGVDAERGEPADSFCPGTHSLRADGKLVGIAQRVREDAALVSGVVVVRDHDAIADVLDPVYAALGVPFDPSTVGSVARAGGPDDPETVARSLEDALVGDRPRSVETVGEG